MAGNSPTTHVPHELSHQLVYNQIDVGGRNPNRIGESYGDRTRLDCFTDSPPHQLRHDSIITTILAEILKRSSTFFEQLVINGGFHSNMITVYIRLEKKWQDYQESNLECRVRSSRLYPFNYSPMAGTKGIEPLTRCP